MREILKWTGIVLGSVVGLILIAALVILGLGRARFAETHDIDVPWLHIPTEEEAVVAYLRNIPPVDNVLPETKPGPMLYALIGAGMLVEEMPARVIDHEAPFVPGPAEGKTAEYGAYLAEIGQCTACHGAELAGGQVNRSAPICPNLTPVGALQGWTKADSVTVLRTGTHPTGRQLDTYMPWEFFGKMTDEELGALWAFLQSQPSRVTVLKEVS